MSGMYAVRPTPAQLKRKGEYLESQDPNTSSDPAVKLHHSIKKARESSSGFSPQPPAPASVPTSVQEEDPGKDFLNSYVGDTTRFSEYRKY